MNTRLAQTDDLSYLYIDTDGKCKKDRVYVCGYEVKPPISLRLQVFRKSLVCVTCGVVGSYLGVDKPGVERPHVNLYAIRPDGDEVLMTKDHILPKSKGGKDEIENMQTMCAICNVQKGNTV